MTRPETAIAALATFGQTALRAASASNRGYAYYPARSVNDYPTLLLFWDETVIDYGSEQIWIARVRGQLMVSQKGDKLSSDIARADPLIVPLVDAFAPGSDGYNLKTAETGNLVDYCRVERVRPSLVINFGGVDHYASELTWGMKIRRFTGGA